MLREFIDRILDLSKVQAFEIEGRTYADKAIHPVLIPAPIPISVHSLTAIKDYVAANPDGLILTNLLLHVETETKVVLMASLEGPFLQRKNYMIASFSNAFRVGEYLPVEQFIIDLQTRFLASDMTASIIKLVGNLTDGRTTNFNDDGISQQVTAKVGITRVENVPVPSPVLLQPFRTFPEIQQPMSNFLFRIKTTEKGPACALIPADGDYWKATAMNAIKAWLEQYVTPKINILA